MEDNENDGLQVNEQFAKELEKDPDGFTKFAQEKILGQEITGLEVRPGRILIMLENGIVVLLGKDGVSFATASISDIPASSESVN